MTDLIKKPKTATGEVRAQIDQLEQNFDAVDQGMKSLTLDKMNQTPKQDYEPSHRLTQNQIANSNDIYLKPTKTIGCRDKFNERFRDDYNYMKQYVPFIAEHSEVKGDVIETWTRPFGGMPAEFWNVPTGVPVFGPRYLAEQIKRCFYHRLKMEDRPTNKEGGHTFYGQMAVDTTVQRLDARPFNKSKSIFLSSSEAGF